MVKIEIIGAVLTEAEDRHSGCLERDQVRATKAVAVTKLDAQRLQYPPDLAHHRQGGFGHAGPEGPDAAGSEIRFGADDMVPEFILMDLEIGPGPEQPLFLGPEGNHPDGAARVFFEPPDQRPGGHRDHHPSTVIDRPGAEIPTVQMAADNHHFLRCLAAGNLADHIGRLDGS